MIPTIDKKKKMTIFVLPLKNYEIRDLSDYLPGGFNSFPAHAEENMKCRK